VVAIREEWIHADPEEDDEDHEDGENFPAKVLIHRSQTT
jgi:hypothetical protein